MSKRNLPIPGLLALAAGLMMASMGTTAAQTEMTTFTSTNELFRFSYPSSWLVEEHADGAGAVIASSTAALQRFTAGTATASGDLVLNITFTPTEAFGFVFLRAEPGASTTTLAEAIMPALGAVEGSETGETEIVALEGGREVAMTPVTTHGAEGAVGLFEAIEGVIALTTIVSHPGEFDSARETALAITASVSFEGTVEQLFDAIEVPEPLPFTPV